MIGTIFNDRYRLDSDLGQGGMGIVYRGFDLELEREVAIKVLSKTGLGTEGRGRLLSEARTVAKLNHPNIITVYDVGEARAGEISVQVAPYIVMEFVDGKSLHEDRPGSLEDTLAIVRQVCIALQHAHNQGVIHRDLKPENVVIAGDGTAKLMDFGLARSIASRYTMEGTVAGTVFYLAPEQALGQEIDRRTDLYSLGVMMYELITGELPFVDPDPIAVISQHLHAPVVPPRAKNDRISPVLNRLILDLMSKDPNDRPISAGEVLQILDAPQVDDEVLSQVEELSLLDRIVRGRMVGRERELLQARQLWQNAAGGEGQLLLISGEPGIGKTRLMHEIATLAEVSGGQVLVGECQAGGNAPYAPFAQITRRALKANGDYSKELPKQVLADLLELAPDLSVDYPGMEQNPRLGPEAEQVRLFENVVRFCDFLCQKTPLMVVLEDIHWADSGSLQMLEHLARRTRQQPVMLLGTYREIELDEALPFHEALLNMSRRRLGHRIKLERLDKDATHDLLAVIFAEEITPEFLEGIYKETEGNPFFIEEVCKALVESGEVWYEAGKWDRSPNMEDVSIPQGIKVAIQSRVSRLSDETRRVLLAAGIIGREFDYDTLKMVTDKPEERLIDCLEETIRKQLIEEARGGRGEQFSFTHALIPGTLRESISGLRRIRLHRQVAVAIEKLNPEDYERLAYHWGEAGDEERGLECTIKAAERARQAYANDDAIRLYSEALELIPAEDPVRFDLLEGRAAVYGVVGKTNAQQTDVEEMLAMAKKEGDDNRRGDALLSLANLYQMTDPTRAREPAEQALEIARKLGDLGQEGQALNFLGVLAFEKSYYEEACIHYKNSAKYLKQAGLISETAESLSHLSNVFGYLGDGPAAFQTAQEALDLSREVGDKLMEGTAMRRLAIAYAHNYQNEKALPIAEKALKLHREVGDISGEIHVLNALGSFKHDLGMFEEAEADYIEGLRIAESINQEIGILWLVANLSHLYDWSFGQHDKSLELVQGQLDKAVISDNNSLIIGLKFNEAYTLNLVGKSEQALDLAETIFPDYVKLMDKGNQADLLCFMGVCCAALIKFELAYQYLESAKDLCSGQKGLFVNFVVPACYARVAAAEGESLNLQQGLERIKGAVIFARESNSMGRLGVSLLTEARLHLALLDEGNSHNEEALDCTIGALEAIAVRPGFWEMPEQFYFQHSRALRVNGREEEADQYLRKAYERMMMVSGNISDEDLRRSYLENIRHNREIQELYRERFEK